MASKDAGNRPPEQRNTNSNEVKLRQTCDACQAIKTKCSRGKPSCQRCLTQSIPCHYSVTRRIGRPRRLAPTTSPQSQPQPLSQARQSKDQGPILPQEPSNNTTTYVRQMSSHFYGSDWGGFDVDADNDQMIADDDDAPSSSVNQDRSQASHSMTPRMTPTPNDNMEASFIPAQGLVSEIGDQDMDLFDSCFESTEFSTMPSSSLSSSVTNDIRMQVNPNTQQNLDDTDVEKQRNSLEMTFGHKIEQTWQSFMLSKQDEDIPFGWEFPGETILPAQGNSCRCLESALGITLRIRKGHAFTYAGALDLALDTEAQLREIVPVAVHCATCKAQRGEILKLFSNSVTDVVDLLQQLCNIEFADCDDSPTSSSRQMKSSIVDGLDWVQPPNLNGALGLNSHERNLSRSSVHMNGSMIGSFNSSGAQRRLSTSINNIPSEQHHLARNLNMNLTNVGSADVADWRILVGRHMIVGDDRKFMLMHLLRRRLRALSNVLEDLIRAMQDLRMALRRKRSLMALDNDSNLAAEMDTRAPLKAASKLYDIIDHLEKIQI
ncbi:conserved hypothetical protein [Talaromyces stipitatus ATCC 10500]|uniref:Zn(2)-C6 fungal-type domain-containing protein n=1 Tax=Talaromyces stipitatus (strain ATCC 10500 / CBS 375.48 / QM 6759 / NRRL 1006) TaxID=441959 RepID=B8MB62_TALSN|nr:uncharacterized protein TSTA_125650 [Talaromyces stipitatus ATCC 10500]EED18851.1 conserved hypothetical protein [Talaromyces stipitatus ATCC 10500]